VSTKIPVQFLSPGPKTFAVAFAVLLVGVLSVLLVRLPPKKKNLSIKVLALASTGNWAAGGTADGTIRIWNLKDGRATNTALGFTGELNDLRFSAADKYLAVANRNITLVSLQTPDEQRVVRDDQANYGTVRFSANGRSILTVNGKGAVLTIDLTPGTILPGHCCTSIWGEVDFTPEGSRVVWAGHWPGLWDLRSGTLVGRFTESRQFMTFGPITWGVGGTVFMGSQDGRVYQWDAEARKLLRTSPPQFGYVHSIAVLGNSGWIAYAAENGPVHLWHPETGASRIATAARTTSNLVFDESRSRTALGTASGTVEFWDLVEGRILNTLD
jgi:WD40 repeat protein